MYLPHARLHGRHLTYVVSVNSHTQRRGGIINILSLNRQGCQHSKNCVFPKAPELKDDGARSPLQCSPILLSAWGSSFPRLLCQPVILLGRGGRAYLFYPLPLLGLWAEASLPGQCLLATMVGTLAYNPFSSAAGRARSQGWLSVNDTTTQVLASQVSQ